MTGTSFDGLCGRLRNGNYGLAKWGGFITRI